MNALRAETSVRDKLVVCEIYGNGPGRIGSATGPSREQIIHTIGGRVDAADGELFATAAQNALNEVHAALDTLCIPYTTDFERRADEIVEQIAKRVASVHERHHCPTCGAPAGMRCVRKGRHVSTSPPLRHPHAARLHADGLPLR
jgi:hypothetical protein